MRRFREEEIEFAFPTQTVYQLGQEEPEQVAPVKAVSVRGAKL